MKLIAFDGDHTLWMPLDGVCLSDRTPTDAIGWNHFTYKLSHDDPLVAVRDDGARFQLRSESRSVFEELRRRGVLVGVISYNHEANIRNVLAAFGLLSLVDYIVAEWHTRKGEMLSKMLQEASLDGHSMEASDTMLIDDDQYGLYRGQFERLGAGFLCFGEEIHDLGEVLASL